MGFKFTSIGAMTLCVAANFAFAETTPGRGAHDARVRVAQYQDGQVYRIVTGMTHVTSVEFAEGETIRSILAGDTEGFMFDGVPGGRAFAIKPVARGVQTNITVYSGFKRRHVASFPLVMVPAAPSKMKNAVPSPAAINSGLRFCKRRF